MAPPRPNRRQQSAPAHRPSRSRRPPPIRRRPRPARPRRRGQRHSPGRTAGCRTPVPRSRQHPVRAMVRRHPRHQGHSREATAELQRRGHAQPDGEPHPQPEDKQQQIAGWPQLEADAEALNCTDASEHQAVSGAGEPWPPQRISAIDSPSVPRPDPETSPENEPAQDDLAARLDELLARADQAAQRIAAQKAERQASSEYAARMELEAHTQAEAGQQAEARDGVELELLRYGASTLPDEPVDQIVHQDDRLRFTRRAAAYSRDGDGSRSLIRGCLQAFRTLLPA